MKPDMDVRGTVTGYLGRLRAAIDSLPVEAVEGVVKRLYAAYREGRKVLIVGNGGSAATASHMACDLAKNVFGQFPGDAAPTGRFKVLALTDNIPLITAWANDAGYERVFLEQVRTFTDPGDVLVAISGSGNSPNVVEAVKLARHLGAETIGILGFTGGKLKDLVDRAVIVASDDYGPIEDLHMALDHIVTTCLREMIEREAPA
jgi:D-sedoheptulose 7-phosphate isomerase